VGVEAGRGFAAHIVLKSEAVTVLRAKIALSRECAFVTFGATKVKYKD